MQGMAQLRMRSGGGRGKVQERRHACATPTRAPRTPADRTLGSHAPVTQEQLLAPVYGCGADRGRGLVRRFADGNVAKMTAQLESP